MEKYDVIIVGGGMAGISAAIWSNRLKLNHLLLESNHTPGGQLEQIFNQIIDYPGKIIENGKELQKSLIEQIHTLKCNISSNSVVTEIDSTNKTIHYFKDGNRLEASYQYLIIATGAKHRTLDIPGEKEMIERGEVYSATRHKDKFTNKQVAIVGGGDRAFEGAMLLANAGAKVVLIHRSTHFRARNTYKDEVLNHKNVEILTDATVTAIYGETRVERIEVKHDGTIRSIEVDGILIRIGNVPNSTLVKDIVQLDNQENIVVNKLGQTNIPFIFAIGDVCTPAAYCSISLSAGQGMITTKYISELLLQN
ncbi:NAD(P)/FAD-dependent oxidoreductase [Robertmurraya kyonggiensis]|uniref:NAD(P)/FAD-dependent oxidoreductase n=1 Tax=Robertmurraya kyonggiensis TaxID=1037680 RepID=A0A4U1DAM1_9BACI|nr:NAD(P)/FAD-dependent oxidoreductase [Robertmurraya kyonggiensis]TKC19592.1 NAD(P)/FAD-dependent oxidoreductase [Robertmurraya kyonggiensis]